MEKTGVPGEKPRPAASHWQTLSHDVISSHRMVGEGVFHQSYFVTGNTNITQQCVFVCYLDNISK